MNNSSAMLTENDARGAAVLRTWPDAHSMIEFLVRDLPVSDRDTIDGHLTFLTDLEHAIADVRAGAARQLRAIELG